MYNPFTLLFIQRRASHPIYLKFGINRFELLFLVQVQAYLSHIDKEVISKEVLFETISRNGRELPKMQGYYTGCLNKGLIATYEYILRPNSLSLGITELGASVLIMYSNELKNFAIKFAAKNETIKASEPKRHKLTSQSIAA